MPRTVVPLNLAPAMLAMNTCGAGLAHLDVVGCEVVDHRLHVDEIAVGYVEGAVDLVVVPEDWSEALAGEVAPFGIRVVIVEPSRFRTAFNAADVLKLTPPSQPYADMLGAEVSAGADFPGVPESNRPV